MASLEEPTEERGLGFEGTDESVHGRQEERF